MLAITALPASAQAQPAQQFAICEGPAQSRNIFGFEPWYACLPGADAGEPRITRLEDIFLIIFPVLESLVKIGALVAATFIFVALFNMVTARGNMQKIAKAAETIRDAFIGFIICLISIGIVNFVAGRFSAS